MQVWSSSFSLASKLLRLEPICETMPLVVCARSLKAELQTGDREFFLTIRASAGIFLWLCRSRCLRNQFLQEVDLLSIGGKHIERQIRVMRACPIGLAGGGNRLIDDAQIVLKLRCQPGIELRFPLLSQSTQYGDRVYVFLFGTLNRAHGALETAVGLLHPLAKL